MSVIVFRSDQFQPYLPDECQVNPNVLGFELAHWLSVELMKAGLVTSYPASEDWGWFIGHRVDDRKYMICCSGFQDSDGAFEWRVFVERPRGLFRRHRASHADVDTLTTIIATCFDRANISYAVDESDDV